MHPELFLRPPLTRRLRRQAAAVAEVARRSTARTSRLEVVDPDTGQLRQVIGVQGDGTITTRDVGAPPPPAPTAPSVDGGIGVARIGWDGAFTGDAPTPLDLSRIDVHLSPDGGDFTPSETTRRGALPGAAAVAVTASPGQWWVRLVAVNTSGAWSDPSEPAVVAIRRVEAGDLAPGSVGVDAIADFAITARKFQTQTHLLY